ncbi:hypothetical protein [Roseomonas elaeocarpi]|uniref:Lysozyme n=1 Tax=Roseomonas elaeocarpi TaxID=907779 RepID=A0ABV6JR23_9PROT
MAGGYSITISAVDGVTKTLDGINRKMAAFAAPMQKLGGSLSRFADTSGLTRTAKAFGDLGFAAGNAFRSISQIVAPLGIISGAASLAGMYRLVSAWGEMGSKLGFASQRIGISTEALSRYRGAAQLAGVSSETLTNGLQTLGQNIFDAIGGRNADAVVMFNTLGIAFKDAAGNARSVNDVLPEVADKIAGVRDPFVQARIATSLFGGAAEELLPFLRRGSAGIREYTELAARYGVTNDQAVRAANDMREAQARLTLAVTGLGNSVSEKLSPVIAPLLAQLADWIGKNREWIATGIGEAVQHFAEYLQAVNWEQVGSGLKQFWESANGIATAVGGWQRALEMVFGLMVARFALTVITPFVSLLATIGRVTAALVTMGTTATAARTAAEAAAAAGAGGAASRSLLGGVGAAGVAGGALAAGIWGQDWMASLFGVDKGQLADHQDRLSQAGPAQIFGWIRSALNYGRGSTTESADTSLSPAARGLLDTIAGTESPGYNVLYGGRRFDDYSAHPNVPNVITSGPHVGETSTAAGRYQFLKGTWDEASKALGLTDFSPASQDRAAWWLAQRDYSKRTGRDLNADLNSSDPAVRAGIGPALRGTWTSLPGGIEAGTNQDRFLRELAENTGRETTRGPAVASGAPAQLAANSNAPAAGSMTVRVEVDHTNAPAGVTARAQASGRGVDTEEPLVRRNGLVGGP